MPWAPNPGDATYKIGRALHRRRAALAAAAAIVASATPVLITTEAGPNPSSPALNRAAVTIPSSPPVADVFAEHTAARQWAATRPGRAPATTSPTPPAAAVASPAPAATVVKKQPAPPRRRSKPSRAPVHVAAADGSAAAAVVRFALAQVGKPYRFATAGPNSFDCSGLAKAAYAQVGVNIPHQTGGIIGRGRAVGRSQLEAGDLVFPSSGHVGIYVGDGKFVHAPKAGDHVRVAPIYAFWAARRLL